MLSQASDSNVPQLRPGHLLWQMQSSTPRGPASVPSCLCLLLTGPAPHPSACPLLPKSLRLLGPELLQTELAMTMPQPSGRVQLFPLDKGWIEETTATYGTLFYRPHH